MISIFIPVRKVSKRVKNKNTRALPKYKNGLTEIKIKQLNRFRNLIKKKKPKFFNKFEFIISTNCEKVKKITKKFSWIRLHERNRRLSVDDSLTELIEEIPKICFGKFILWTHVTSPFFSENDYYDFLNKFFNKKQANRSAFSADLIQKFIYKDKHGWISHNFKKNKWPRTQDLPKFFCANSAAFIAPISVYKKQRDRLCKTPIPIVSKDQSGFDIDTISDFNYLKKKLKNEI